MIAKVKVMGGATGPAACLCAVDCGGRPRCVVVLIAGAAKSEMVVVPCGLSVLTKLCAARLSLPADLRPTDARRAVMLQLQVGGPGVGVV